MADGSLCNFFKFGHCKFGDKCHKRHIKEKCVGNCENEACQLRHPRECKFYSQFKRCKFGEYCSYLHIEETHMGKSKDLSEEIELLKSKIDSLESLIREKDSKINNITNILEELKDVVMKNVIDFKQMENPLQNKCENENECIKEMDEPKDTPEVTPANFNCDECKMECKSKIGLKLHKKRKHNNIPQLDGFDECNISVETQTDYVCEKCTFLAENSDMLRNHRSLVHKKYKCWDCDFSSDQRYLIKRHIQNICYESESESESEV